ncbi:MAG: helix-turn-helix domain-containing protein [Clostridia bacterium]|nr:helix-turn-helix domain-containing protein [Clostridia bacterium]
MKQTDRIIKYIADFGSITALEAMKDLGVMRLSARIWDIRHAGMKIKTEVETSKNRYGEPIHYNRYSFK